MSEASGRPSSLVPRLRAASGLGAPRAWGLHARRRPETLDALKKTYAEITTVEAHFHQKIMIKALKREREMEGVFFYKRSKGFLWKYTAPKEKVFLFDGAAMWQAEEGKSFVTRERIDKEHMEGSFLDLVDDVTRLDALFTLVKSNREGELEVLDLAPKKEGTLQAARIWVDSRSHHHPRGDHRDHGQRQRDRLLEGSGEQARARQPLCLQAGQKGDKGNRQRRFLSLEF